VTEIDPCLSAGSRADRGERPRITSAYRRLLSAPESDYEEVEVTEELPLGVEVLHLQQFEDNSGHADVLLDHGDGPTLVTDDVEECSHHAEGEEFSTLAALGEEYAALEKDFVEVSALMCDLPEYDELQMSAIDGQSSRTVRVSTGCSRSYSRLWT